jgi:pyruvate carboxylase
VSTAEQRLRQLRSRLDTANVRADEAIADYETRRRKLTQANPSPVAYQMAKRDDTLLAEIGRRVEFQTTLATRLAATMTVELLAAVVRHLTNGDGR